MTEIKIEFYDETFFKKIADEVIQKLLKENSNE